MRLFVDENLSPRLVSVGHDRGYDATCDFRELVGDVELHPGLVVVPTVARDRQLQLLDVALVFIEHKAAAAGQEPRELMVNHVVEIGEDGTCELYELPVS